MKTTGLPFFSPGLARSAYPGICGAAISSEPQRGSVRRANATVFPPAREDATRSGLSVGAAAAARTQGCANPGLGDASPLGLGGSEGAICVPFDGR